MPTTPLCVRAGDAFTAGAVRVTVVAAGRNWCIVRVEHNGRVTVERVRTRPKRRCA